jgi:hypothetical protein
MGLAPEAFWSLTVREFWIKHRAFTRSEDRQRSLMIEHAARTGQGYKDTDRAALHRHANALRRYPLKKWLLPES